METEGRGTDRSGHLPLYAILSLLGLLLMDLFGGLLPVPEWALVVLAVSLSAPVASGLFRSGYYSTCCSSVLRS